MGRCAQAEHRARSLRRYFRDVQKPLVLVYCVIDPVDLFASRCDMEIVRGMRVFSSKMKSANIGAFHFT